MPGTVCPVCRSESEGIVVRANLNEDALRIIRHIYPDWQTTDGLCLKCIGTLPGGRGQLLAATKQSVSAEDKRLVFEYFRWLVGGIVAVIGFLIVSPREQGRLDQQQNLAVFQTYLDATETDNWELWKQRLSVMKAFYASSPDIMAFVARQEKLIPTLEVAKSDVQNHENLSAELSLAKSEQRRLRNDRVEDTETIAELQVRIEELEVEVAKAAPKAESGKQTLEAVGLGPEPAPSRFRKLTVPFEKARAYYEQPHAEGGTLRIRVIDVGAGLSVLLSHTSEDGKSSYMMYDAGPRRTVGLVLDQANEFFTERRELELLVLSHSDADHYGAIKRICEEYSIANFLRTGSTRTGINSWRDAMEAIEREVREEGAVDFNQRTDPIAHGSEFYLGATKLTLLSGFGEAPEIWHGSASESRNSLSIVLRIEFGGKSVLFMGDAGVTTEQYLLETWGRATLNSDVIIAAKHGSRMSSSREFIEMVDPRVVIFAAGNRFGHPAQETVDRFLSLGNVESVFRTDLGDNRDTPSQWQWGALEGGDTVGDDHVDIEIRSDGTLDVAYSNPEQDPYLNVPKM